MQRPLTRITAQSDLSPDSRLNLISSRSRPGARRYACPAKMKKPGLGGRIGGLP